LISSSPGPKLRGRSQVFDAAAKRFCAEKEGREDPISRVVRDAQSFPGIAIAIGTT
jgi:hypothetical protein